MPSNPPPRDPAGTDNNRPLRTLGTNTQRRRRAAGRILVGILFPELHAEMFGHPLYRLPRTINRTRSGRNGTNDPDRSTTVPFSGLVPQNLLHRPQIPARLIFFSCLPPIKPLAVYKPPSAPPPFRRAPDQNQSSILYL